MLNNKKLGAAYILTIDLVSIIYFDELPENTISFLFGTIFDIDLHQKHLHLLDRNLTLINITNFKFLINNDICNVSKISLVTMIHSSSPNIEVREMIR